jgi:hypothetical protein
MPDTSWIDGINVLVVDDEPDIVGVVGISMSDSGPVSNPGIPGNRRSRR